MADWIGGKPYTSVTDSGNSSVIPIANGGSFIGVGVVNQFASVMIALSTDQNGILYCEFSVDGTNWDTSLSFQYFTDRINPPHIFEKGARYFRVRFVNNSGADQTYFRLGTYYGSFNKLTSPINGTLSDNYDALVVRPTDYRSEVAMGKRQGRTTWNKWGFNDDVDTSAIEVVASWGGTFTPLTEATTISIVSTSANDITSTGSGIRAVVITGIDANREYQIEVAQMNGTTPVVTTSTWLGINRVAPFLCGSSKFNEGTVTLTAVTNASIMAQLPIGQSVTQQAIFHIQSNHNFLISWIHINVLKTSGGSAPKVTVRGIVFSPVANAFIQLFKTKIDTSVENSVSFNNSELLPVTENSVLFFTAETNTNNTSVDIRFSGIEERIT